MKYIFLLAIVLLFSACAPASIPDAAVQNVYVSAENPLIINTELNLFAYPDSQVTSWGQEAKRTRLWFTNPAQLTSIAFYIDSQFLQNSWIRDDFHINDQGSFASGYYTSMGEKVNFKLFIADGSFRLETW